MKQINLFLFEIQILALTPISLSAILEKWYVDMVDIHSLWIDPDVLNTLNDITKKQQNIFEVTEEWHEQISLWKIPWDSDDRWKSSFFHWFKWKTA